MDKYSKEEAKLTHNRDFTLKFKKRVKQYGKLLTGKQENVR